MLPSNYEINQAVAVKAEETVGSIFSVLRGKPITPEGAAPQLRTAGAIQSYIEDQLQTQVPLDAIRAAMELDDARLAALETDGRKLASGFMLTQRIDADNREAMQETLLMQIADLDRPAADLTVLSGVVGAVVQPNLVLDPQKVGRAREQAMRAIAPIYIEQGQIIIRKGDLVEPEHVEILRDLGLYGQKMNYAMAVGIVIIVALLLVLLVYYVKQYHPESARNRRQQLLLGLTIVVVAVLAKLAGLLHIPAAGYLIPTALAGILISILLDTRLAVIAVLLLTVVVAIVMGQDTRYVVIALAGGLAGVFSVSKVSQRSDVTRAGLIVGFTNFLAMIAFGLLRSEWYMLSYAVLGVVNGLVSAVLAIGLLPYLETAFDITSAIRLLELSNPNHPLMRTLLMEAPGSYHHSMIVGNLAEAAAEAVGADALLARVQAQYHDIGKTRRPYFFIENQYGADNPHDRIAPSLSTLIITSHVKDGLELARQYKLPKVVVDVIPQHHGTDMVKYFYHKAMESAKEDEIIDKKDFSYPGPPPQSKETAIVMLADSVEAAVRSLKEPTPGRIEGVVRKLIKDRLHSGQLDESDLTFKDLDKIAEAFVRVLAGLFHHRIEYPDMTKIGAEPKAEAETGEK